MPRGYGYEEGAHKLAADHVAEVNSYVRQELSRLKTRMAALEGPWTGLAATTYQQVFASWDRDATRLTEALDKIGELLRQSGAGYNEAEGQSQDVFSKIMSDLAPGRDH
jgi:early secretory antigenic target protein ESAT-6